MNRRVLTNAKKEREKKFWEDYRDEIISSF